jgi:hypothetical protein
LLEKFGLKPQDVLSKLGGTSRLVDHRSAGSACAR